MPSRRDQITLSEAEQAELLDSERVVVVSSHRPPRLAALDADVVRGPRRRDLGVDATPSRRRSATSSATRGRRCWSRPGTEYIELRGIQIEAEAELVRDPERVAEFGAELTVRYSEGIDSVEGDAAAALRAQAAKRVAIRFEPIRVATWDHRKLGGTY